jgi:hypothetical protein
MRTVRFSNRDAEVPTTWQEGEEMLTASLNRYFDKRGGNLERMSCAARVAFAFFGERFLAPDPTTALIFLLQEICKRKGAELDGLERPRRWLSVDGREAGVGAPAIDEGSEP